MTPSTVLAIKYLQKLPNTTTLATTLVDKLVGGRDKPTAYLTFAARNLKKHFPQQTQRLGVYEIGKLLRLTNGWWS